MLALAWLAPTGTLHTLIYSALLVAFARTLRPGHEALVTRLARQMRGPLPPDVQTYSRGVTWAWTLFCAAQLLTSALLHQFARHQDWAFFVNRLNLPLLALMAIGEYTIRRLRFRELQHASPWAMVKVMRGWWK